MKTEAELQDALRWLRAEVKRRLTCRCLTCLGALPPTQAGVIAIAWALDAELPPDECGQMPFDKFLTMLRDDEGVACHLVNPKTAP